MSNEMIERVARAIEDAQLWPSAEDSIELAKAAIEAMREPTDEMLKASWTGSYPNHGTIWRAMIDVALKDDSSGVR